MATRDELRKKLNTLKRGTPEYQKVYQAYQAAGRSGASGKIVSDNVKLGTAGQAINTTYGVANEVTPQGNLLTNPNQSNPFGSQTVTIDPVTGQPTVSQGLSQDNSNVLAGLQGTAVDSNWILRQLLNQKNTQVDGSGGLNGYENAVFSQLTHGVDRQKARDEQKLSSTLANRGIPVGSKLYNDQMREFNDRYDQLNLTAKNQAITQGASKFKTETDALSGLAKGGLFLPSFQGFNSVQYQQPDINSIFSTLKSSDLGYAQLNAQQKIAAQQLAAQKAAQAAANQPVASSPFNSGPPPGS
jgi:hypothetical protein